MAKRSTWSLFVISLLAATALSQDLSLFDALDDSPTKAPPAKPKPAPGGGGGGGGEKDPDLLDFFDFDAKPTTKPPRRMSPKAPVQPKPKPKPAAGDFDLSDALDPKNDIPGGKGKGSKGSELSDRDLHDLLDGNDYKPDKSKGSQGGGGGGGGNIPSDNSDYDTTAETGTIAGIASAVVMALVGAVSSYISYQKKKLCFGLQQNMNSEYQKAENPEAVVFQEAPIQETRLQPPNAEPNQY